MAYLGQTQRRYARAREGQVTDQHRSLTLVTKRRYARAREGQVLFPCPGVLDIMRRYARAREGQAVKESIRIDSLPAFPRARGAS